MTALAYPKPTRAPRERKPLRASRWGVYRKSNDPHPPKRKRARRRAAEAPAPLAFPKPERKEGTKYSRRPRDFEYMGWTKRQPCVVPQPHVCRPFADGRVQAMHTGPESGPKAKSHKGPDHRCLPGCLHGHKAFDQYRGPFKGWSYERRQRWVAERLIEHHARFLLAHPHRAADFPALPPAIEGIPKAKAFRGDHFPAVVRS